MRWAAKAFAWLESEHHCYAVLGADRRTNRGLHTKEKIEADLSKTSTQQLGDFKGGERKSQLAAWLIA